MVKKRKKTMIILYTGVRWSATVIIWTFYMSRGLVHSKVSKVFFRCTFLLKFFFSLNRTGILLVLSAISHNGGPLLCTPPCLCQCPIFHRNSAGFKHSALAGQLSAGTLWLARQLPGAGWLSAQLLCVWGCHEASGGQNEGEANASTVSKSTN